MWQEPEPSPPPPSRPQSVAARDPFTPARSTKVGRNDPCPCGSGLKYKHCCGKRA
ncbi:MAG: SEC-C domain-containing protein [Anaerolineae bacterium]|nr:SEC-C domain-containing protein [Anaerolineae bacterium]